jgi:hypothetical protein
LVPMLQITLGYVVLPNNLGYVKLAIKL